MTLAEFCEFTRVAAKPFATFTECANRDDRDLKVYTIPDSLIPLQGHDRWLLHHLTDYVVSSITAGTIWLVER